MLKRVSSKVSEEILAAAQESKNDRIWCEVCGSDSYILIERARWRRRHGDGFWDIDYMCTNCDSFYGHVVKDEEVTPALMAAMVIATNDA